MSVTYIPIKLSGPMYNFIFFPIAQKKNEIIHALYLKSRSLGMSFHLRYEFNESIKRRTASEKTILAAGNYILSDLIDIVLEYSQIENLCLNQFLDMEYTQHNIDNVFVCTAGVSLRYIVSRDSSSKVCIGFTIYSSIITITLDIQINDVLRYIEHGDILPESDAMRVINETFGYIGTDYNAGVDVGILLMRSFFDYFVWSVNRLDNPVHHVTYVRVGSYRNYDSGDDSCDD